MLKELGQWLFVQRGTGERGMVPASFVSKVEKPQASEEPQPPRAAKVQATRSVTATASNQLSYKEGDVITVLEQYNTGWLRGELNGAQGLVEQKNVKPYDLSSPPATPLATPPATPRKHLYRVRALYDYTAQSRVELSFKKGDVLAVLKEGIQGGWLLAEHDGKTGHVPESFCSKIRHRTAD